MGWWRMNERGGIKCKPGCTLQNDVPGKDSVEELHMGDRAADIMSVAVDVIIDAYKEAWGSPPCMEELHGCLNFINGSKKLLPDLNRTKKESPNNQAPTLPFKNK